MTDDSAGVLVTDKLAYDDPVSVGHYEKERFSGVLGRARNRREKRAGRAAVQQFMSGSTVLDCPSGNGRWFSRLAMRANYIIGVDVAPAMLDVARTRSIPGITIDVREGDAENLELEDEAVEHVFCFALMKHIPRPVQLKILKEFKRVSSGRMAISFCVSNPASKAFWLARKGTGYLHSRAQLDELAHEAGLRVRAIYPVGVPVLGLEAIVVLERL